MERMLSFKEWMIFLEGSFTEADIPPFFYVGCHFSEDFVKHYSFTPPEAAVSLVGLEGITSKSDTAGSFSNGATVKMPGKALVDINKISRSMYDNPHYMASAGFRTPRRLKAGSDPLSGGKKSYTTDDIVSNVVSHVLSRITSRFPEMGTGGYSSGTIKSIHDGSTITAKAITDMLKKLKSKGILGPKQRALWGSRAKDNGGRNVKPLRARHNENQLKHLKSADDLADRLMVILRAYLGEDADKLKEPSGEMNPANKPVSLLKSWVRAASLEQGSGYEGEKEWIMKRQPLPGVKGKTCPHCRKFNQADASQTGQEITCWNCGTKFNVSNTLETGGRPVLHIPIGSSVVINTGHGFPSWGEKYIGTPPPGEYWNDEKKFQMLMDKTKLYKKLNVYLSDNNDVNSAEKTKRPYDPERQQTQEDIKRALMRDVPERMLEKLMASKGTPPAKLKTILDRWEKAGMVKRENGKLSLIDPNFDEDQVAVYEYIKNNDNTSDYYISAGTGLKGQELKNALDVLIQKGKIQKLSNGNYDITLSPEEMNTVTEPEQKVLDAIKKGEYSDYYDFSIPGMDSHEVKGVLKNLLRKQKIFKSTHTGNYRATMTGDEPLSKAETKILDFLKKWPNSDKFSLERLVKNHTLLGKALDGLMARKLVTIDTDGNIILDKSKTPDHQTDAKEHSSSAEKVLKLVGTHFLSSYREIAGIMKWDVYQTDYFIKRLVSKGLLAKKNYRLIPTPANYLQPQSKEEQLVLKLAEKKDSFRKSNVEKIIQKKIPGYSSTGYLLQEMVNNKLIASSYHPLEEETYYHGTAKAFNVDTAKYEKAILDGLEEAGKPVDLDFVQNKITEKTKRHLSEQAVMHLLQKMLGEVTPKIKSEEDFVGNNMYFLSHMPGPKKAEEYFEPIRKVLEEKPLDYSNLHTKAAQATGLGYYEIDSIIRKMMEQDLVKNDYSNVIDDNMYFLPGQKLPEMSDYKEQIMKIIAEKPHIVQDIYKKLVEQGIAIKSSPLTAYLNELAETDEPEIVRTKGYDGKFYYHMAHHDPNTELAAKYEKYVLDYLSKAKNNEAITRTIGETLYYNYNISWDSTMKIFKDMIAKKILWVKEGDLDDKESMWEAIITTNEVDPATVVKNPAMAKAEPAAMEYMHAHPGEVRLADLGGHIKMKAGISSWTKAQKIVKQLIADGKLVVTYPLDDYDFWDQKVVLPGQQPKQEPTTPQQPVPTPTPQQPQAQPTDVISGDFPPPPTGSVVP